MYYFAYGSNMDLSQMRRLCGWHCFLLGRAELENFEIGLDKRGYGNIRPKQGGKVYGLLYEMDEEAVAILDEFEGSPQVFQHKEVTVLDEDKKTIKAYAYIETEDQFGGSYVNLNYWQRVVTAAKDNKLPQEWVEKLEKYLSL